MALDGLLLHQVQKELQSFLPAKLTKLQQVSDTEDAVYNTDTKGNTTIDDFLTQRIQPYQSDSGIIYHDGDTGKFSHAAAKAD